MHVCVCMRWEMCVCACVCVCEVGDVCMCMCVCMCEVGDVWCMCKCVCVCEHMCNTRNFCGENFRRLLTCATPKDTMPPNFMEKTFTNSHKTLKFPKDFSLESFPLYDK